MEANLNAENTFKDNPNLLIMKTVCHLTYVTVLITSWPILTFLWPFNLKKQISFRILFLRIRLGYLRTDNSGIEEASLFHLIIISLSLTVTSKA